MSDQDNGSIGHRADNPAYAEKREVIDFEQASEYRRATIKYIITINSGAAVADLAFLSQIGRITKDNFLIDLVENLVLFAAVSAIIFVFGTASGALASYFMSEHRQLNGWYWQRRSYGEDSEALGDIQRSADNKRKHSDKLSFLGLILFILGTLVLVSPFVWGK